MKRIRVFAEYLAAFLVIFLLISTIAAVVAVKFYGDELQEYTMDFINEQVDTKISIDEVGVSIFRKFPNTAVFFNDVTIWSGHRFNRDEFAPPNPDTLFTAERLYVKFNLLKLIRKKFSIKSLEARRGELRILIDANGNGNFEIQKERDKEKSTLLEMKGVSIRDFSVTYINYAKSVDARFSVEETSFEGNFAEKKYNLNAGGSGVIQHIINHGVTYLSDEKFRTDLNIAAENNHYQIDKGNVMIGEQTAAVFGEFLVDKDVGSDLDLHFEGSRINLGWISGVIANRNISRGEFSSRGNFDLIVDVTGLTSPTLAPRIEAYFSTRNASLSGDIIPLELRNINLEGTYSNGSLMNVNSTSIELNNFSVISGNSTLSGRGRLENLLNPRFSAKINGEVELKDLERYLPGIPVRAGNGKLLPDLFVEGRIRKLKGGEREIKISPSGIIESREAEILVKPSDLLFKKLNGTITVRPEYLEGDLSGFMENIDFQTKLKIGNPLATLGKNPGTALSGTVHVVELDIDELISEIRGKGSTDSDRKLPEKLQLDIKLSIDKLSRGHIETREVKGNLFYRYPNFMIEPLDLYTMNGKIHSIISITGLNSNNPKLDMRSGIENVEIQDVFTGFNNFNQEFITDKNIRGRISGASDFSAVLNEKFRIQSNSVFSENTISIEKGELIDFEPLIGLSDFLKIDRMDHVQFSRLNNTIIINENRVIIPAMDINSNALNINASGEHSFNKTYEYHLAARLSDLLFRKAKNARNREFDIALDKEDKRTIFLVISDAGEGMKISFDEEQAMQKIRQDLRNEKRELKTILNKEFGIFGNKNSDTVTTTESNQPDMKFEVTPGEEPADSIASKTEKKTRWWQRKQEEDKKPEFEFVIEDDDL